MMPTGHTWATTRRRIAVILLTGLCMAAHTTQSLGAIVVAMRSNTTNIALPVKQNGEVVFTLVGSLTNSSKKAARLSVLDSWRVISLNDAADIVQPGHSRDFLRDLTPQDCPLIKSHQTFHIKILCKIKRVEEGWVLEIGDGVGGSWAQEIHPGRMKFCLVYQFVPSGPVQMIANSKFNFKNSEFWEGVAVSNWEDIEYRSAK